MRSLSATRYLPLPPFPPWAQSAHSPRPPPGAVFAPGYALCPGVRPVRGFPGTTPHMMSAVPPCPGGRPVRRLPGTRYPHCLPLSRGRSLRTVPGPRRGCFAPGRALCPGGRPVRGFPGTHCLPLSHGRSLRTAPGLRWGLFFVPSSGRLLPGRSACPPQSVPMGENCSRTGDRLPRGRSFFRGGGIGW